MLERTKRRLRLVARVTLGSAAAGVAVGWTTEGARLPGLAHDALLGGLIGATIAALESGNVYARRGAALQRLPLSALLALRTAVYALVIVAAYAIAGSLVPRPGHGAFALADFAPTLAYSLAVSLAFSLALMVRRLLGPQATAHFLTGRYHRPRREGRLVLFLDVAGSTALAERMGDTLFHGFLAQTVLDISESVTECAGEIYRYVGDEVIVTWRLRHGKADPRALLCPFVIAERITANQNAYTTRFAAVPVLHCAFHAGPLIIGEMGDVRREIVMLGDTMNTAARIEDACRSTGKAILASAEALAHVALPAGLTATSIGNVGLRGKATGIELFALARA